MDREKRSGVGQGWQLHALVWFIGLWACSAAWAQAPVKAAPAKAAPAKAAPAKAAPRKTAPTKAAPRTAATPQAARRAPVVRAAGSAAKPKAQPTAGSAAKPKAQPAAKGSRFRHSRYRRDPKRRGFRRFLKPSILGKRATQDTCRTYLRRTRARYCVELLTMGQGKWLFTYFGHNALRVYVRHRSFTRVYNFGTFSFAKPMVLLWNYLQFNLQYQLSTTNFRRTFYTYRYHDRTLQSQRLLLTPRETAILVRHLRWHYQPSNRRYKYHHYLSNCSTKVRDALHKALGPDFRKYAKKQFGTSYRRHVMKAMQANPLVMTLMDFGMGPPADKPIDWWADMFLPHQLQRYLTSPLWKKVRGRSLATKAITHYKRKEKPARAWNPVWIVWTIALLWLLLALLLFQRPALRWYLRSTLFLFSILGCALFFMLLGTNFPEPPGNANVIWFHPFHLVVWWWLSRRRWATQSAKKRNIVKLYVFAHLGLAGVYLLLKLISVVPVQANAHYVFFAAFVFGIAAAKMRQDDAWLPAVGDSETAAAEIVETKVAVEIEESVVEDSVDVDESDDSDEESEAAEEEEKTEGEDDD